MTREAHLGVGVLASVCIAIAAWCFVNVMPVAQAEERAAQVLARAGPNGAAAYKAAWADGRLTRNDMHKLRDQAGRDIDAWIASETGGKVS